MSRTLITPILATLAIGAAALAPMLTGGLGTPQVDAPTADVPDEPTPAAGLARMPLGSSGVHATVEADRTAILATGDRQVRVRLDLTADAAVGDQPRVPTDLVLVIDRSGSMAGDKMLDAKAAAVELVGQLGAEDRFGLVSFASDFQVDVPLQMEWTNPTRVGRIEALSAGGGTAMAMGLTQGLAAFGDPVPGRSRRVVLISDGLPDSPGGLADIAQAAGRAETPLTTVGIGMDYDETLMQRLADAGTGNFHWVQRGPELVAVLGDELDTARETVASGVRLELNTQSGARVVDAAGYPVVNGSVELGALFAGQHRSLWVTLELPEGLQAGDIDPGSLALSWTDAAGRSSSGQVDLASVEVTHDRSRFLANVDSGNWSDCVVQEDYNDLRTTVSAALQRGDAATARGAIDDYRDRVGTMNAVVGSVAVTDNLAEVEQLATDLEVQLTNPRHVQNAWAKGTSTSAYQGRRSGQSKAW